MDTITVNGKTYYSDQKAVEFNGEVKIVVLQRGWILIGRLEETGQRCKLHNASVIRRWGTTEGLGQLAKDGPQDETVLDRCNGLVEFDILTMVLSISVDESKWPGL